MEQHRTNGEAYDKGIRKDQYTGSYGDFKPKHIKSDGDRYPNDIVCYEEQPFDDFIYVKTAESEGPVLHPTQKPVELGRYLIKTFTKPGDIVLDNACGSIFYFGVSLSGQAFRSNLLFVPLKRISTSIPNAIKTAA